MEHGMTPKRISSRVRASAENHRSRSRRFNGLLTYPNLDAIRYLHAPDHLSPTHEYGVAFERGTLLSLHGKKIYLIPVRQASIPEERSFMQGTCTNKPKDCWTTSPLCWRKEVQNSRKSGILSSIFGQRRLPRHPCLSLRPFPEHPLRHRPRPHLPSGLAGRDGVRCRKHLSPHP